ncbi:MAG: RNA polymerase sigma factor [Lachnospiraceae bacterium]|nr:RNA polymerase sigma factor [Lachnospiraceae bacterium]
MDDRTLIARIQRGQTEALNEVANKYYDDIYRFCYFLTGYREESYDLAQETFLKFIKYVDHYQYKNLKGYLLTIARNICIDYMRDKAQEVSLTEQTPNEVWQEVSSEDQFSKLVQREALTTALWQLPRMQREALLLYYYHDLKLREIAAVTGTNLSTVKSRIRQGTDKLKKWLKE